MLGLLSGLFSFATSQIGSVLIAGVLAFAWGHYRADNACADREAARNARALQAQMVEQARQAKVAEQITLNDKPRVVAAEKSSDAMRAEIDRLRAQLAEKPHAQTKTVVVDRCVLDNARIKRMQRLDAAAKH